MTPRYQRLFLIMVFADVLIIAALGVAIHSPWFTTLSPHMPPHYEYDWTFDVGDYRYGLSGGLGCTYFSLFGSTRSFYFQLPVLVAFVSLPPLLAVGAWLRYLSHPKPAGIPRIRKRALMLGLVATLTLYMLSSGPAMHLRRTAFWSILDIFYRPLGYLEMYTPAKKFLVPYWNFWIEPDENPLYFG